MYGRRREQRVRAGPSDEAGERGQIAKRRRQAPRQSPGRPEAPQAGGLRSQRRDRRFERGRRTQLDDVDLARHGLAQRAVSATDDEADPMATLGQRAR